MARKVKELGALVVSRMTRPGMYTVGGVAGLALQVSSGGGRSWLLRYSVGSKRRELGLGGFPDVTLASAREAAREAREKVRAGIDPIEQKRVLRSELSDARAKAMTFKACAEAYIAAHEAGFKNAKHRAQWSATLKCYAYPEVGNLLVGDVELVHVLKILEPIWYSKTETAKRLRGRIERVLDWATGRKLRSGDNPARWKGLLQGQLPPPSKISKVTHHAALPLSEMVGFMARLHGAEGVGARALEFLVLTAARSGEVRGAKWTEISFETKIWTIPAVRMKAGKEHRVALSPTAINLLRCLSNAPGNEFVFAAPRGGSLSDMALTAVMRRMGASAVPHGFRSSFRDWAAEYTNYPSEAAEMALAHSIGNKVEAAYRRGDLLEKRKAMMADWAAFCSQGANAEVISIMQKQARS
jgi:integrase